MKTAKKKWVAFRTNATIPADVIGEEEDTKVNVGEPVHLPEDYAKHVVHDRFADYCDPPKKKAAPKKASGAQEDAAQKLADAQAAVTDAESHLKAVAGTDGEGAAREALSQAEAALKELQPGT